MNEEKLLYFANAGSYDTDSKTLDKNLKLYNLIYDMVHVKKYLNWDHMEGTIIHSYTITPAGKIRLALYRYSFSKNFPEKQEKRLTELTDCVTLYTSEAKRILSLLDKPSSVALLSVLAKLNAPKPASTPSTVQSTSNGVLDVLLYSKELGNKNTQKIRTHDYVFKKIGEEVGELSVEMQVEDGLTYKKKGSDGVEGESIDICICAIDCFALQFPDLTAEEIMTKFNEIMLKKLNKWKSL